MNSESISPSEATNIVYFGAENLLRGVFSRSQAIARQLARSSRVLYVNSDFCSVPHYVFDQIFRGNVEHPLGLEPVSENLWVLDCLAPVSYALMYKFNRFNLAAVGAQVRTAIRALGFQDYLLWFGTPWMAPIASHLSASRTCYDYMDDFPGFFEGRMQQRASQRESQLLRSCDFVIATSHALLEKARQFNTNVHLVRNGVALDQYTRAMPECPPELLSLPRPILGYIGTVGTWFDVELFAGVAAQLGEASLVILGGGAQASAPELSRQPNVKLLGWKPHKEIPQYLAAFDVCLIPFILNDLTLAVNPIKFFEHCAAGKPTVSVSLPELDQYREICYLAATREEFIQGIHSALREAADPETGNALALRRQRVAEENSWDTRGRQIASILRDYRSGPISPLRATAELSLS